MLFQFIVLAFAVGGAVWFTKLVVTHGWGSVQTWLKGRALATEAALKAKAGEVASALEPRLADVEAKVKALAEQELATVKGDIAALKAKVGA